MTSTDNKFCLAIGMQMQDKVHLNYSQKIELNSLCQTVEGDELKHHVQTGS